MDLKQLKSKIDERKTEMLQQSTALGETNVVVPSSSDSMLHELLKAHQSGQPTEAIKKIQAVNEVADTKRGGGGKNIKAGGGLTEALGQHDGQATPQMPQHTPTPQPVQMSPERDRLFEQTIASQTPQGSLTSALSQYGGMTPEQKYQQMMMAQMGNAQAAFASSPSGPVQINEQAVQQLVSNTLNNTTLMQEVLKSTLMEMYQADKIKNAILENQDMIKKIVRDTIIELSKQNKKSTK